MQWIVENNEWFFPLLISGFIILSIIVVYYFTFKIGIDTGRKASIVLGFLFLCFCISFIYTKTYSLNGYTKVSEIKDFTKCQKKEIVLEGKNIFKYECPTIKQKQIRINGNWYNLSGGN